jgi:hypothetical protein
MTELSDVLCPPATGRPSLAHSLGRLEPEIDQNVLLVGDVAQVDPDLAVLAVDQRRVLPRAGADEGLEGLAIEVVAISDGLGVLVLDVGEEAGLTHQVHKLL